MATWRSTPALVASAIILALCALVYWVVLRPAAFRGRQVRSLADMNTLSDYLERFRDRVGDYPASLAEAIPSDQSVRILRDGFGHPFQYEAAHGGYVLVSYGADGESDGVDYWNVRALNGGLISVKGDFRADQVRSDRGWHIEAGK